jgi:regulatory protein
MKVTSLKIQARNKARVNVYLDGKFAFGLAKIVAARLALGQELTDGDVARLKATDDIEASYERALRFLGPRPRSETEVRRRLKEKGVEPDTIDEVVARLNRAGLVNDQAFASYWVENRGTFRPRSSRVLRMELKQKGVSEDVLREALSSTNDEEAAYTVAAKRARRLAGLEKQDFRRKLGEFLARRGFGYDTIEPVVERVWQESQAGPSDEP